VHKKIGGSWVRWTQTDTAKPPEKPTNIKVFDLKELEKCVFRIVATRANQSAASDQVKFTAGGKGNYH